MRLLILLILLLCINESEGQKSYKLNDKIGKYVFSIAIQSGSIPSKCKISGKVYYNGQQLFRGKTKISKGFYRMEWLSGSIGRRFKVCYYPSSKTVIFKEGVKMNGLWPDVDSILKTSYLEGKPKNQTKWEGKGAIKGNGYKFGVEVKNKTLQLDANINIDTFSCKASGHVHFSALEKNVGKPQTIFKKKGLRLDVLYKGGDRLRIRAYWKGSKLTFKKKGKIKDWTIYIDKNGNITERKRGSFITILKATQNKYDTIDLSQQYGVWRGKARNVQLKEGSIESKVDIMFSLTLNKDGTYSVDYDNAQVDPNAPVLLDKEIWTTYINFNEIQFQKYNITGKSNGVYLELRFSNNNNMLGVNKIKKNLSNIEVLKLTKKVLKIKVFNQIILLKR